MQIKKFTNCFSFEFWTSKHLNSQHVTYGSYKILALQNKTLNIMLPLLLFVTISITAHMFTTGLLQVNRGPNSLTMKTYWDDLSEVFTTTMPFLLSNRQCQSIKVILYLTNVSLSRIRPYKFIWLQNTHNVRNKERGKQALTAAMEGFAQYSMPGSCV